ncbi:eukaryotic translation initiation factor 4 gamma 3-like [Neoarius graeffei]|uniref:eukaryotic translation initiation factor 4 gamma 3-like n=1 Tax=Neoarius graeffei TaxID=443677 RepID=UPI00298D5B31|nr:eukaryotic translation initiation factor 4 gamma 3-like [Neoarius graeffei]
MFVCLFVLFFPFFFLPFPAGTYSPAQAQYQPLVLTAPVMMNPAQQQQAPPPQQQVPPQKHKRERKQRPWEDVQRQLREGCPFRRLLVKSLEMRIRDPNQGGRDITEDIIFGRRTTSTPTSSAFRLISEFHPPPE